MKAASRSPEIVSWMADYARVVSREFGDIIGVACTINEPNIVASAAISPESFLRK